MEKNRRRLLIERWKPDSVAAASYRSKSLVGVWYVLPYYSITIASTLFLFSYRLNPSLRTVMQGQFT